MTALLTAKTAAMSSTAQEHVSFSLSLATLIILCVLMINFRDFLKFIETIQTNMYHVTQYMTFIQSIGSI